MEGSASRWSSDGPQMVPCVAWMLVRTRPLSSDSAPASRVEGAGGRGGEGRAAMLARDGAGDGAGDAGPPPSAGEGLSLLSLSLSRLPPPKSPAKRPRFSSFFSGLPPSPAADEAPSEKRDEASMSLGGAGR